MKLVRISSLGCVSCIVTKKDWDEIKENYDYLEYDYDLDYDEIEKYNVGNILPVIIVFDGDKEKTRIIGEKSKEEILELIR